MKTLGTILYSSYSVAVDIAQCRFCGKKKRVNRVVV